MWSKFTSLESKSHNTFSLTNLKTTHLSWIKTRLWRYFCSQNGHRNTKPLLPLGFNIDHGSKGLIPKGIMKWPIPILLFHRWKNQDISLGESHTITELVMEKRSSGSPGLMPSPQCHKATFLHQLTCCLFFPPSHVCNFHISLRFDILLQTFQILDYTIRHKLSNFYHWKLRKTILEYDIW